MKVLPLVGRAEPAVAARAAEILTELTERQILAAAVVVQVVQVLPAEAAVPA
jgi:hypothetical protein